MKKKISSIGLNIWNSIYENIEDKKECNQDIADKLLDEWIKNGYVNKTCKEMLELSDDTIALFYIGLLKEKCDESPVINEKDSSWMLQSDFCFINVRATGIKNEYGNFITASKLLPSVRAKAIHLCPFTSYDFSSCYIITSNVSISANVVDKVLWSKGISPSNQLEAFVRAAHALDKCIGYDIEPHMAQFSRTVLERPELFRWISIDKEFKLSGGLTQTEMLNEDNQKKICSNINEIVSKELESRGLITLECDEDDSIEVYEQKEETQFEITGKLISEGYWTILGQAWCVDGIPNYTGYNIEEEYAEFEILDENLQDKSSSAHMLLTPYSFYYNVGINIRNKNRCNVYENNKAIKYYSELFLFWRDRFAFDFIRFDSVDHVFDSMDSEGKPTSDRVNLLVLKECIEKSRNNGKRYIGAIAERMGSNIEDYSKAGFDLLLGYEMLDDITARFIYDQLKLDCHIRELGLKNNISIAFAIDSHDTGDDALRGVSIIEKQGPKGMLLRLFVSRFLHVGVHRPKYEVMGAQDLSYGLHESNIRDININWIGNKEYNQIYNYIEDVYEKFQFDIINGGIVKYRIQSNYCWWLFNTDSTMFLAVVSLQNSMESSNHIQIDMANYFREYVEIYEYDFYNRKREKVKIVDSMINISRLDNNEFKFFEIILYNK